MKIAIIVLSVVAILILIYIWMIKPRVLARPDMSAFQGQYFAHRGLHDVKKGAPENSLKAFRRAVKAGYGIELDVQLSKDGMPVIFHDYTLDRICGVSGRVEEYTYEELKQFPLQGTGERIPTLTEALNVIGGKVPLIVELKAEGTEATMLCTIVDKILSAYRGPYCIESFHPLAVYWYRCNRGTVIRGQLADCYLQREEYRNSKGGKRFLYFLMQNLLTNFLGRPDFVAYNHECSGKFALKVCGLLGVRKAAWTIRSEEELEHAKEEFTMYIFEDFTPQIR